MYLQVCDDSPSQPHVKLYEKLLLEVHQVWKRNHDRKMQHFHVIKLFEPVKDKELNIQEVKKSLESLMSPKEK